MSEPPISGWLRVRRRGKRASKRRWAVLCGHQLQLFESERGWRSGARARLAVPLDALLGVCVEACASGDELGVALMGAESFSLVPEEPERLELWLQQLKGASGGSETGGLQPVSGKRQYERMWYVTVSDRGLGSSRRIAGNYWVGLTHEGVQLISRPSASQKQEQNVPPANHEIPFHTIRGCHHMDLFFCMEVGRSSPFGAGELFMVLEERIFAQNMHEVIKSCFSRRSRAQATAARRGPAVSPATPVEERNRALVPADTPGSPTDQEYTLMGMARQQDGAPADSYMLMAPAGPSEPISIEGRPGDSSGDLSLASPALSEPAAPTAPISGALPDGIRLRASSLGSRLGRGIFRRRPTSGSRPVDGPGTSAGPRSGKLSSSLESTLGALFAGNRRPRTPQQSLAGADQYRSRSGSYGGRGSALVAVTPAPLQPVSDATGFGDYMLCEGGSLPSPAADYLNMQPYQSSPDAYLDMRAQPLPCDDDYLVMDMAPSLPPVQESVAQLSDYLDMTPGSPPVEPRASPTTVPASPPPSDAVRAARDMMTALSVEEGPARAEETAEVEYVALDLPDGAGKTRPSNSDTPRQNLSTYSQVIFDKPS